MKKNTIPREEKDHYKYRYQGEKTLQMPSQQEEKSPIIVFKLIICGIFGWALGWYIISWIFIPLFWIYGWNIDKSRIVTTIIVIFWWMFLSLEKNQTNIANDGTYGVDGFWRTSKNGKVHWVRGHTRRR